MDIDLCVFSAGDATARIWDIEYSSSNRALLKDSVVLKHYESADDLKDVTTVNWSVSFK